MSDQLKYLGQSLIQHGKENDRIYIMKYDEQDEDRLFKEINQLIDKNEYGKIIAKLPKDSHHTFIDEGFVQEAHIPEFYDKDQHCAFMAKYNKSNRRKVRNLSELSDVLSTAIKKKEEAESISVPAHCEVIRLDKEDAVELANIYKQVFKTYPFPVHNPEYLKQTMDDNIIYFGIRENGSLVSVSSAETDPDNKNAEMTDFATLPKYRGNKYALMLLDTMEKEMRKEGYRVLYTIARAISYGMNITFAKADYTYSGRLINNTNISGNIESMNIWYKDIS
jgi:putative beta-lysine N-acetyltransferase